MYPKVLLMVEHLLSQVYKSFKQYKNLLIWTHKFQLIITDNDIVIKSQYIQLSLLIKNSDLLIF